MGTPDEPTAERAPHGEPQRAKRVRFWIRSSRGTDQSTVVTVPEDWGEEEIRDKLERWCSQFGAWHVSDNFVRYGYDSVEEADHARD